MMYGSPKYVTEDLLIPATFLSKHKEMRVWLIPVESVMGPDNTVQRVPNTGCRVRFKDFRLLVRNKAVLKLMMEHKKFNQGNYGYSIDEQDPSGFWRANGVVKTRQVTAMVKADTTSVAFKDLDLTAGLKKKAAEHQDPLLILDDGAAVIAMAQAQARDAEAEQQGVDG